MYVSVILEFSEFKPFSHSKISKLHLDPYKY